MTVSEATMAAAKKAAASILQRADNAVVSSLHRELQYGRSVELRSARASASDWAYTLGNISTSTLGRIASIQPAATVNSDSPVMVELMEELKFAASADGCSLTSKDGSVTVAYTTPDIVLHDINLGPFKVSFIFSKDSDQVNIEASALRPHKNSTAHNPHPHISSNRICLGDGSGRIMRALSEFRINDAYQLVLAVLNNYNERSPYRRLEEWKGRPCNSCGAVTEENILFEGRQYCPKCVAPAPYVFKLNSIKVKAGNYSTASRQSDVVPKAALTQCGACKSLTFHNETYQCNACNTRFCNCMPGHRLENMIMCPSCYASIMKHAEKPTQAKPAAAATPAERSQSTRPTPDSEGMVRCSCGARAHHEMVVVCSKTGLTICPICDPDETGIHRSAR